MYIRGTTYVQACYCERLQSDVSTLVLLINKVILDAIPPVLLRESVSRFGSTSCWPLLFSKHAVECFSRCTHSRGVLFHSLPTSFVTHRVITRVIGLQYISHYLSTLSLQLKT